ncbi:MAG TPA: heme-binding domain-containing protein [Chryseolinea sp.]|nr:heme-binding domain-containing protein [Chryseolinea sp.]
MIKKIILVFCGILLLVQFIRPEKNLSDDRTFDISKGYVLPESLALTFQSACNDCHTNKTTYPWYAEIQPVASWLNYHVTDGKRHLNLSTFTKLPIAVQNHKLEEIMEMVKEGEMPLESYTWFGLHKDADLSDQDRSAILDWAGKQMDSLKRSYPADSLVMKKRSPPPNQ